MLVAARRNLPKDRRDVRLGGVHAPGTPVSRLPLFPVPPEPVGHREGVRLAQDNRDAAMDARLVFLVSVCDAVMVVHRRHLGLFRVVYAKVHECRKVEGLRGDKESAGAESEKRTGNLGERQRTWGRIGDLWRRDGEGSESRVEGLGLCTWECTTQKLGTKNREPKDEGGGS